MGVSPCFPGPGRGEHPWAGRSAGKRSDCFLFGREGEDQGGEHKEGGDEGADDRDGDKEPEARDGLPGGHHEGQESEGEGHGGGDDGAARVLERRRNGGMGVVAFFSSYFVVGQQMNGVIDPNADYDRSDHGARHIEAHAQSTPWRRAPPPRARSVGTMAVSPSFQERRKKETSMNTIPKAMGKLRSCVAWTSRSQSCLIASFAGQIGIRHVSGPQIWTHLSTVGPQ